MPTRLIVPFLLLVLSGMSSLHAQPLPAVGGSPATLAANLRAYLVEQMPPVLHEDSQNWGAQKLVARGIEWKGKGIAPRAQKSHKNHGVWRRVRVTAVQPRQSLQLDIRDVRQTTPESKTFTTFLALDTRVEAEQQNWRAGVRVLSGSFKARMRVKLTMQCEVMTRLEKTTGVLPDVVFRMRVLSAKLEYDHFVTEHVAGVGGEMAEWIGDAGLGLMKQIKPSLERNALQKAGAAIVRAADTKEVRLSLGSLFPK
jgi:hypothetical protein